MNLGRRNFYRVRKNLYIPPSGDIVESFKLILLRRYANYDLVECFKEEFEATGELPEYPKGIEEGDLIELIAVNLEGDASGDCGIDLYFVHSTEDDYKAYVERIKDAIK